MKLSLWASAVLGAVLAALLCSVSARADEAEDQYAVAAAHYAQKRWQFAAEEFQTFVQKYPHHPRANQGVFFLAETLTQLGRLDEAATRFREYLSREPNGRLAAAALFRTGEVAYLAGRLDQAKVELERFCDTYPDDKLNAFVLPYLGQIALSEHKAASAGDYFRRGLSRFPQGPMQDECRFGLAQALEKQGQLEEAERFYLAVAAKTATPLADEAQFHLGALQYASGEYEATIETFEAFESTFSESPWQSTARLGRGWALFKLGRLEEAKSAFRSIASDAKLAAQARYWLGLSEKAEKNWQAAARTLLEAAADHPDHELARAMRFHAGDCLNQAGAHAAANKQYDLVIASTRPDNQWIDDALRGKVQVAIQTKDYETLDRQAAEFAGRFPHSPWKADVQRMLARSLLERKLHARAVEVLEPLVAAEQDGEPALEDRYALSLAYKGLERHEDALRVLSPVAQSATGDLRTNAQLAQASLWMQLQRFDEAIVPLEALLSGQPTGDKAARCLGNLAICYAETGQLDKAKERYAELLAKHPHHELIAPTTSQLAEAAYDAADATWADTLFAWLARDEQPSEYRHQGLSGLGWSQYESGRLAEAAETYDRLLQEAPDPALAAQAALMRGRILHELGDLDSALAMYDLVIDRYQDTEPYPEALWASALLRDSLDQDQEATALYERLATAYPEFPEIDAVLYNWAWALGDLGQDEASSELFNRLRTEHPESAYRADAALRLAQRALAAEDYERSRQLVEEILAGEPTPAIRENALYLQGQIAAAEQKWDEARLAFSTLTHDYPQSPLRLLAEYGIAEASFRQNDYPAAGELLERLVRQTEGCDQPWLAVVRLRLAQALCHQKKWDQAYEVAAAIEKQYPDFEEQYEVDYVIGRCLSTRAEFQRARETYRKVIRSPQGAKTETAAKAQLMIAESYYHQQNYQQALREYLALEILYDYPTWQAAAVLQAGKCHEMLGEWEQAADEYARLLADYPQTSFAKEARERIEAARQRRVAVE